MKTWHHWTLTLNIRSPFLFEALEPGPDGFDSAALRNLDGDPVIPGDHIRGHVSHALRALLGEADTRFQALFGQASKPRVDGEANQQDMPAPGHLLFSDAIAQSDELKLTQSHEYPRVQIDDETGTAKAGMLQFIELPALPGAVVNFTGTVSYLSSENDAGDIGKLIENALLMVPAMGALKSSGFGELVHEVPRLKSVAFGNAAAKGSRQLTISFDRPLLVDTHRAAYNAMEGSTIVPGGAIKGALGRLIEGDEALNTALSKMVVSHAFPLLKGQESDRPLPLAFAIAGEQQRLVLDDNDLMAMCEKEAPVFAPDWKPKLWARAQEATERMPSQLKFQSRGHVAMDNAGIADDGLLFVTRHVETAGRQWRFSIDQNDADGEAFQAIMDILTLGLPGIGRTGAILKVDTAKELPEITPVEINKPILLILETPALLTNVLNHDDSATTQYSAYFAKLLGDQGFANFRAIAQRKLVGDYLAHRYRLYGEGRYVPFEVTNPGAVFALTCTTQDAVEALNTALRTGLPPTNGERLLTDATEDWKACPFMNHNGFGRISNVSGWLETLKVGAKT